MDRSSSPLKPESPSLAPRIAPHAILELVQRFQDHEDEYHRSYSEAQLRQDFIDPLFESLGWDVKNTKGFAEAYREVVVEDALRVDGTVRAPDYAFRNGGTTIFYVEAKKPQIDLFRDSDPAYQLRRYGWNAKLALSILTNFEEFAIYECVTKPLPSDKASTSRVMYFKCTDLADRWHEISELFSPDGFRRGAFDRYALSPARKRGTAPVDAELLKAIREWRELLARNVALRNSTLTVDELNYVVQATLDRIVFLRICEDRRIEPENQLRQIATQRDSYRALAGLFRHADAKYNSGLFYFKVEPGRVEGLDRLCLEISVDDAAIHTIITSLYFPESPFEFSVIPPAILGQIYEQFLGETIRLTPAHRAVIEVKPEVRKVGGVFYTPIDVVDRIVERTVTKSLDDMTVTALTNSASRKRVPLAVLDPACGSGTFLLEAYQSLLDWYLNAYLSDPEAWTKGRQPRMFNAGRQGWRLSSTERKRILIDHIFGVDVDAHAVEVTKLSLLLKVLEGETDETIGAQLRLFHARALPNLELNIRCGNSLIGPDLYKESSAATLDQETLDRLNPFQWEREFEAVMSAGGFTSVIGNPPYVLMQNAGLPIQEAYLADHYRSARYKIDTYHVFMERSLQLLRDGGRLGFITPSSFLLNRHAEALRDVLLEEARCESMRVNLYQVFADASVDTTVSIWRKGAPKRNETIEITLSSGPSESDVMPGVEQDDWKTTKRKSFQVLLNRETRKLVHAMESSTIPLGSMATAYFGIQTFGREKYVAKDQKGEAWKPVLDGGNIGPYSLAKPLEFVCTDPSAIKSGGELSVYEADRIGVRQIGARPIATILPGGWYSLNTIYNVFFTAETRYDLRFILGLMNSDILAEYWRVVNSDLKPTFPKIKKDAILDIPVPVIEFSSKPEKHNAICEIVSQLIETNDAASASRQPLRVESLRKRARQLKGQLESLIRDLYQV